MRNHHIKFNYIFIPLATFLIVVASSRFLTFGATWYNTLILPKFAPSAQNIGMIWLVLFILTAFSLLIYWNRIEHKKRFWVVGGLFVLIGFLNILWSFYLFLLRMPIIAFVDMLILNLVLLALLSLSWRKSKVVAILLFPYSFWTIFALIMNYFIIVLN